MVKVEKEYLVTIHFDGYAEKHVKASSEKEAREKARNLGSETDCGELENIEYDIWYIEEE